MTQGDASGAEFRIGTWPGDAGILEHLRETVFVKEQNVPKDLEWDGRDAEAIHAIAEVAGRPVGCGRLLGDGRIGRLAVLEAYRRQGVGLGLLDTLLHSARKEGLPRAYLHAQEQTLGFYERAGFKVQGRAFLEADIYHREMVRVLDYRDWQEALVRVAYPRPIDQLAIALARATRRDLAILSPDLDPRLFATGDFVDVLRALIRHERQARIRIIVRDARDLARSGHALLTLARRAPSKVALRCLPEHPDWGDDSLLLRDRSGLLHLPAGPPNPGTYRPRDRARTEKALGHFETLWRAATEDPEFRALAL